MLHAISEPWSDPIVRRALLEIALLSISAGAIGCWIVLYNLSYSSESLAHAMLPGLVVAALTGIPLIAGGAIGLAGRGWRDRAGRHGCRGSTATPRSGSWSRRCSEPASCWRSRGRRHRGSARSCSATCSASPTSTSALAAGLAVIALPALALLHRQLLAVGFDRSNAAALGARVALADIALLALIAAIILVAVQGLGNLLVVALVVGPAATARLVAGRVPAMMALAIGCSLVAGIAGLYVSYYASTAAGATIAGAIVVLYLLTLAIESASSDA